jgi:hypothetical protein
VDVKHQCEEAELALKVVQVAAPHRKPNPKMTQAALQLKKRNPEATKEETPLRKLNPKVAEAGVNKSAVCTNFGNNLHLSKCLKLKHFNIC